MRYPLVRQTTMMIAFLSSSSTGVFFFLASREEEGLARFVWVRIANEPYLYRARARAPTCYLLLATAMVLRSAVLVRKQQREDGGKRSPANSTFWYGIVWTIGLYVAKSLVPRVRVVGIDILL